MKRILFIIVLAVSVGFLSSCQDQSEFPGYKKTATGLYYKFYTDVDDTLYPKVGDFVDVDMIYATEDTVMFDSRDLPKPMQMPMVESVHAGDIYEGMALMNIGDSATFICNADSVLTKLFRFRSIPPELDSVENIYFHVKMKDIMSKEAMDAKRDAEMKKMESEELELRSAYLLENYPDAEPSESGLFFISEKKGTGSKPETGQKVKVHYTGMFLDGTKFDSSVDRGQPFEFTLGQQQVISGWDEGIAMMRKGGKAILVIPSDIAYGPSGRGSIPPFSTLVFEVELIDFE
jgi:FKBP-type peptidyl-prolyl cis-trans isomerase